MREDVSAESAQSLDPKQLAQLAAAIDPRAFELIIMPTEQCNFRCVYCYEDFSIGRMSPQTVQAIKWLLERRIPRLRQLHLSWFGGEPLAAKDICLDISEHAHELAVRHGVHFTGTVTTNGWLLTVPLLRKLSALKQRSFQITLDGDAEAHNRTRIKANGSGTFARIWSNLMAMAGTTIDFSVTLRLHLTPDNLDSQERLIDKISREIGDDARFEILFHAVSDLGGPHSKTFGVLNSAEYNRRVAYLQERCQLACASEHELASEGAICYAAKANSFVIRANGHLAKCTVALDDDRNDVGIIRDDGSLQITDAKVRTWMTGFADFDRETLGCPLSTMGDRDAGSFKEIPIRHVDSTSEKSDPAMMQHS